MTEIRHRAHLLDMLPIGASDEVSRLGPEVAGEGTRPMTPSAPELRAQIAALYREHFQFVWRSLRRLGVADRSIDDAVQDVFLVAHRKLAQFEGRSSHRSWLFAIAIRVANEHRRRDERLQLDETAVATARAAADPSVEVLSSVHLLDRLLEPLNETQRATFVMAEIEGFSAPEIAETLGVKLNTVYSRLRLARARFERALARHKLERTEVSP